MYVIVWPGIKGFYNNNIESKLEFTNHLNNFDLLMTRELLPMKYNLTLIKSEVEDRISCLVA